MNFPTASASALTPEAAHGARFHGIPAQSVIAEEQPHHRHAAYLFAMGADTREVADALGVTTHAARNWLREPWFQEQVSRIMEANGGRDLTQCFINEAFATFGVMLELRDGVKTPATVRAGVCRDILDRAFGKPKVFVETTRGAESSDPVAEVERLEKQNAELLQAMKPSMS